MKKILKSLVICLFICALSLSLFACGGSRDPGETNWDFSGFDAETEGSLKFAVPDGDDEEEIALQMIAEFNKKFPKVKIEVERITGSYSESLLGSIFTEGMADVFYLTDEDVKFFAHKNVACDISVPFSSYDEIDEDFNEDNIVKSMLDIGRYKNGLYMIPRDYNKIVVAYNKTLFKNYNITPPTDDWTWEDFVDTCEALRAKMPASMYPSDLNMYWLPVYNALINGFGGSIDISANGTADLSSEGCIKALQEMRDLVKNKYSVNPATTTLDTFKAGMSAMYVISRPYCMSIIGSSLDVDYVSFPELPEKAVVGTGCSGYGVYKNSKNKELAFLFLMSIISEETQEVFGQTGASVPVLNTLHDEGIWREIPSTDINHDAFVKFPERDLVATHMDNLNPELSTDIEGFLLTLIKNAVNTSDDLTEIAEEQEKKIKKAVENY